MGWASGVYVFDLVFPLLLELGGEQSARTVEAVVKLIDGLEDHDWDTLEDTDYYDHPTFREAMDRLHPGWFDPPDEEVP